MSQTSPGIRIGLLMAAAAAWLYWTTHHVAVSFSDGLRYVREARQIASGDFSGGVLRAIDHPVHALSIAATHAVLGGEGPYAWQTAAQVAAFCALVLAVIPLYLLAVEAFDDETTAWVGCVLVVANPVVGYLAVNVLSESTFLLFWLWGLWASARFLREGSFLWLVPAITFGVVAYLTRPEGLLLHAALVLTLLLLPLRHLTRIYWPRWWAAVGLLLLGPVLLVAPYVAAKGTIATKPAFARVIGVMPKSPPQALERDAPPPQGQTVAQAYFEASKSAFNALRGAVTIPLIPLAVLGLVVARPNPGRARLWVFFGVLVAASTWGLIRLHVTGGYCTARHALIPAIPLIFAAAHGLCWLLKNCSLDARTLRLGEGRVRPGPVVWLMAISLLVVRPMDVWATPSRSSFLPYRLAGAWLAAQPGSDDRILDLTDWTLFFSGKHGDGFEAVTQVSKQSDARWLVLRDAQINGNHRAGQIVRGLIEGRSPSARFPETPGSNEPCVEVYDLRSADHALAREFTETGARLR